jgi:alpha/beta superfamily hydrolase
MAAGFDKSVFPETIPHTAEPGRALRSFFLDGEAGRLEALLNEGSVHAPFCAVVCHPHPKGGGTMHNKVVYRAAKVFSGLGWPVLRFNFRGVGLSQGEHDGRAEARDVTAALDWLAASFRKPIVAAGFSFGAATGLKAASVREDVAGFAALGLPTHAEGREYRYPYLEACQFPKLFLSGDRDQYAAMDELRAVVAAAPEPKQLVTVGGADHFFAGQLEAMQAALGTWLRECFPARPDAGGDPAPTHENKVETNDNKLRPTTR